jgi:hypothetical protein
MSVSCIRGCECGRLEAALIAPDRQGRLSRDWIGDWRHGVGAGEPPGCAFTLSNVAVVIEPSVSPLLDSHGCGMVVGYPSPSHDRFGYATATEEIISSAVSCFDPAAS